MDKSNLATPLLILIRADTINMTRPRAGGTNTDEMTLNLAAFSSWASHSLSDKGEVRRKGVS